MAALRLQKEAQDGAGADVDNVVIEKVNDLRCASVRGYDELRAGLARGIDDLAHEAPGAVEAEDLLEQLLVAASDGFPQIS